MKYLIIFLLMFAAVAKSQIDQKKIENSFILHLYLDDVINFIDQDGNEIHDLSLLEQVTIKYDYLSLNSANYLHFDFYSFTLSTENISFKNSNTVQLNLLKTHSQCNRFLLAFNTNQFENKSYRLQGFTTNDLLFLLDSIKQFDENKYTIKKYLKKIDKEFGYIDFKCMYVSIKKNNYKSECVINNCLIRENYTVLVN